ncbi:family 43 glycosylhydrolase [Streptomyces sp. H27-H1]|uniref:family 43 glycosylhydrolase n=1 Tax=Streptomyces sp. H27-H1 TaxID=2996461 RepID=UPI00226E201D|nr:family 43 glycosylhydrolase [Streptomyces sp. H27-H1]MCY0929391.1 family 43 glycosylhydrolase [Streptomyces sp. H27-H1]
MSWLEFPMSRRRMLIRGAGVLAGAAAATGLDPFTQAEAQESTYANPVIWQDFADVEVIRVGADFYMTASTMHYSPGAPVLHSRDLVNWEFIGHSVPRLDFSDWYDLNGGHRYVGGIWASSITHRASENRFYWLGQIDFYRSFMYTATDAAGPWTRHAEFPRSYYDAGMLVDTDDTIYVAYGATKISVAQLSADGKTEVRNQQVFSTPSDIGVLEGSRFYKINGNYYIFATRPPNGQYILKSSSPWGPYEVREVLLDMPGPIAGGGVPHQGGLVSTPNGAWYYMGFVDAYPGGRMPALAPITWTSDGWPEVTTVNGAWGQTYPFPSLTPHLVPPLTGADTFTTATLAAKWEWNHNPDNTKWSTGNGLKLQTATVTNDLYAARNTLTHRIQGPSSTATVELDPSAMANGDRAGLAMLRNASAWIGLRRDNGVTRLSMTDGLTMDSSFNTSGTGTERASAELSATVDPTAWYVLLNRNSGKALDVSGVSTADGARLHQWTRTNANNQQFQFVDAGGGYYKLRVRHSGKVVDVLGGATADGASVVQWTDVGGSNQQFRLDSTDGYVRLVNRNSNKVLEVAGLSTADGAAVQQWGSWNGSNQQWQLVRVDGGIGGSRVWLRVTADIRPDSGRQATFSYSTDGTTFTPLGPAFTLDNRPNFFMGYRFAIFNYATAALGGAVAVNRFSLTTP